jgi:peptidoglycan/xylan/chitin deacetylase (PgdA/CDA1 family)
MQDSNSPMGMIVLERTFERLLQYLKNNCEVVAHQQLPVKTKHGSDRASVLITFDDGWKDTFAVAFPLAKKFDAPITVFVCPALVGRTSPFWPERFTGLWRAIIASADSRRRFKDLCIALDLLNQDSVEPLLASDLERLLARLKELPVHDREQILQKFMAAFELSAPSFPTENVDSTMTWDEIREFVQQGGTIGSHTAHHQLLTTLPKSEIQSELADAKREIEKKLGGTCEYFAYPNGSWSQEARDLVIREAHSRAFVNHVGLWTTDTDSWLIPRVNLWEGALLGPSGQFSAAVFQYTVFWRSFVAEWKRNHQTPNLLTRKSTS